MVLSNRASFDVKNHSQKNPEEESVIDHWSLQNQTYRVSALNSTRRFAICLVLCLIACLLLGMHEVAANAWALPPFCYDQLPPGADFKINDDTAFSTDWEKYPAVFVDGLGRTVVAWSMLDAFGGKTMVLFKRWDDQNAPSGCALRVDDDTLTPSVDQLAHFANPRIAGNYMGNFVIAWGASEFNQSRTHVIYSLVFQLFDADGFPIGKNVVVDSTTTDYFSSHWPSVAMAPSGDFVIVWHDELGDVYASKFLPDGTPNGGRILVNGVVDSATNWMPSVTINHQGGFVVAWQSQRNDSTSIRMQRFDSGGVPIGPSLPLGTRAKFPNWILPVIGCDTAGAGVVVWAEPVPGHFRLLSQRFDSLGGLVDSNSLVAELDSNNAVRFPSVVVHKNGEYAVAWSKGTLNNHEVYVRHFDAFGQPVDSTRVVNDATIKEQYYPMIAVGPNGQEVVVWEDERTYAGRPDIYLQSFDSAGQPQGGNLLINIAETHQYYPAVSVGATGKGSVVWQDARYRNQSTGTHLYYQRIGADGVPVSPNQDLGPGANASVAMAPSDESMVVWSADGTVYCRMIDHSGTPGALLPIATGFLASGPLAARAGRNWVVAWTDYSSGDYDVYGRILDSLAQPLGDQMRLDDGPDGDQALCSMTANLDGSFWAGWHDRRGGGYAVYLRRFDTAGQAIRAGVRLNDNTDAAELRGPHLGAERGGQVLACWLDSRDGVWNIFAQRVDSAGDLIGGNFKINSTPGTALNLWELGAPSYWHPVIGTTATGVSLVAWPTFGVDSTDEDVWAQWLDANDNPIGPNFKLPDPVFDAALQRAPALAVGENSALAVWMDDRRGTGTDIFGQLVENIPTDVPEGPEVRVLPTSFDLSQNCPNPFNPTTTIKYSLPSRSHVTLDIFNILGQKVRTLVSETQLTGSYRIKWSGTDETDRSVSSGVYFYRFRAGGVVQTRKMLLLK